MAKKKKRFKVQAEVITYCYVVVEADSAEEANEIADGMDGGDFITKEKGGDFNILTTLTQETKEKVS